jgi:maleate cis-trans isomerase
MSSRYDTLRAKWERGYITKETLKGWVALNDKKAGAGITAEEYEEITGESLYPEETEEEATTDTASSLDDMTVQQLKDYASEHGISIKGLTLKADILAAIKAAEGVET